MVPEWDRSAGGGAAGAVYYFADYGGQGVDVVLGGGVAEGEAQGTAGAGVVGAKGQQHVAGLGHARGAGGAGGAGDSVRVEQHEQGVALATREGEVRVAREPGRAGRGAVEHGVGNDGEDPSHKVRRSLPWLYQFYRGNFLELAGEVCAERVAPALDDRYGVVLNVQRGPEMRFECHVDSNRLTGLLFCTDHSPGVGGEPVFAPTRPRPAWTRWNETALASGRMRAT
jgi:hypothetical protein